MKEKTMKTALIILSRAIKKATADGVDLLSKPDDELITALHYYDYDISGMPRWEVMDAIKQHKALNAQKAPTA